MLVGDLLNKLIAKPQREIAGSDTASRFDYQKNWAFCQMLRRHMEGADYLVAFEFHDDVVFLEPSASPSTVEFFQVKTSSSAKPRKLAALTSCGSTSNSILGKLFKNFTGIWSSHTVKVVLVSNVAFEFAESNLAAEHIDPKYRKKIVEKLKAELPDFVEAQFDSLHFIVTGVSIEAMHSFLHGEAMHFFKHEFGEDHGLNVHSWVRLVQSEIARKNNYPSDKIADVPELVNKKCVGRDFVKDSLSVVRARTRPASDLAIVNEELKKAGWNSTELMRLSKRFPTVTADYVDPTNQEAAELVQKIEQLLADNSDPSLSALVVAAEKEILPTLTWPYGERTYIAAMCILVFHEKI